MAVTDELREWMDGRVFMANGYAELTRIADRIDRVVRDKCAAAYKDGFEDAEDANESDGWVRLPVDADGVPIRVGDEVERENEATETVRFISYNGAWLVNERGWFPHMLRHHRAPTVEDVLREFLHDACATLDCESLLTDEEIERYAARLQLREDA